MSTLTNVKKEEYRKKLKEKFTELAENEIDEIIEYLFDLAVWESKVLRSNEK